MFSRDVIVQWLFNGSSAHWQQITVTVLIITAYKYKGELKELRREEREREKEAFAAVSARRRIARTRCIDLKAS